MSAYRDNMKRAARAAGGALGHALTRFRVLHSEADYAECSQCGAIIFVAHVSNRALTGEALREKCKGPHDL